jgi:superfamily II DNA/RNA helicase
VAARGIHVEGIAHVVNFDLPQVPEDFIHRVGRTGRAGVRGVASTFGGRGERAEIGKIERLLGVKLTRREVSPDVAQEREMPRDRERTQERDVRPERLARTRAPGRRANGVLPRASVGRPSAGDPSKATGISKTDIDSGAP